MTIFPHIAHYRILKPSEPHFRGSFLFLYGGLWSGYDEIVGLDSLTHFGEYEDDSVFVRNDVMKCDYEILLDHRNYKDVASHVRFLDTEEQ